MMAIIDIASGRRGHGYGHRHMIHSPSVTPVFISRQVIDARYFFTDLNPSRAAQLAVVCGGYEVCQADYHIRRKAFPWFSVELVVRGLGEFRMGRTRQPLRAGSIFSYGPKVAHEIIANPQSPLSKYFVDFTGHDARRLLRQAHLPPGHIRHMHGMGELVHIVESMIRNGSSQTSLSSAICGKLLELFCLKLAETPAHAASHTSQAYDTYLRCRTELEQHCLTVNTLGELAARCGIDQAYLCRLFKQYDRESPYQLLTRMKMNHAAASLIRSGKLVKQVAQEVGFSDAYHFSRVFKRIHGVSPKHFLS
jgi:AraC-like DNA-binding protein